MLNLLAAMDGGTITLLCVGGGLLIVMFVFNYFASKKQRKAESDRLKSLKIGDRVLMSCGIQGTIVEINEISPVDTTVVIRTGNIDEPCTLTFDVRAVYQTIKSFGGEETLEPDTTVTDNTEEKTDEKNEETTDNNIKEN